MPENATVFQGCQIGVESLAAPGTPVVANKRLLCTGFENPRPVVPARGYRPWGSKGVTRVVRGKPHSTAGVVGAMCPADLAYLLATGVENPTITTPGGGTLTRNWAYLMRNWHPDIFRTLTIQQGSYHSARQMAFAALNGFSFDIDMSQEMASIGGSIIAQTPDNSIVPTGYEVWVLSTTGTVSGGTFTLDVDGQTTGAIAFNATAAVVQAALEALSSVGQGNAVVSGTLAGDDMRVIFIGDLYGTNVDDIVVGNGLITGGGAVTATNSQQGATVTEIDDNALSTADFDIYMAEDIDDLPADWVQGNDASSLLRCSKWGYEMPERFKAGKYVRTDHPSYSALIEREVEGAAAMITLQDDQQGKDMYDRNLDGTTIFMRAVGQGQLIEGSLFHGLMITAAFQVLETVPEDNDGEYAAGVKCQNIYHPDIGGIVDIQLRTTVTSLA